MTDDEKFFAWLDGELEPTEAAKMEAAVASDPERAKLAKQHRALMTRLGGTFDPVAEEPIPSHLQNLLSPSAKIIDFGAAKERRAIRSVPQWSAIAATLAVGIVVGTMIPQRGGAPVELQGGKIYAAAPLNRALEVELASAPDDDVRIGLTFRNRAGEICRSFTKQAASGLACRTGRRWQVKGLFAAPENQGSDYRMAGGMDPNLAALVETNMVGEPFDAATEKAERDRSWR